MYYKHEIFNPDKLTEFRKKLRSNTTKSERILWHFIKNSQLGFKFRRQHGIGNYIVDFYCPELRLVVEIDGLTHADERVFENDDKRQKYLESWGLIVRRYGAEQIFKNIKQVLEDLFYFCRSLDTHTTPSPPPP